MQSKKPPDKYRTIKCSLKSIIKSNLDLNKLSDAMIRTHKLIIHSYQFIRLWILSKYNKKLDIPHIDEDLIRMVFKSLIKESQGPKPKGTNLNYYNEFNDFFNSTYKLLHYSNKIDGVNLSQILGYMATDILTNIENNIKLHFIKYIKKFVNSSFKKINNDILDNCEKGKKTITRKELNRDLYEIKEDLINNTLHSKDKYHKWINTHKNNIFPSNYVNSYEFDIINNPQKYIKHMIYMCIELEKLQVKSFQFFPLRNNIIYKFIPIDTKSLIELFIDKNKNDYLTDIEHKKYEIWDKLFKLNNPIFKQTEYEFDYRISTDCFSVSIQLIHKSFIDKENNKKLNMKNKKAELKNICKEMTQEEKEKYKQQLEAMKKDMKEKFKLENKLKKDKYKEEFKKLSKEEKKKIIDKQKENNKKNVIQKYIEFPYLEDLNDIQYEELKNNNWIVADPGKRHLLYMKSKDGKVLKYSNRKHLSKTKRLKYQRLLENYKVKNDISIIENGLSQYNSKSCIYDNFKEFIKNKNRINEILFEKYDNMIFRKYKWYGYINRKKAETDLVRDIKTTFGKDSIMIHGDYSGKGVIKYISSPNVGLKRKLAEYIKVYNIDEFRTSCLNYKTENKCENIYLPDKNGVIRKIHSILTFQMENKRMGCINRDMNAVNNMYKIVQSYLIDKTRPEKFKRDYKFSDKIKNGNPIIHNSVKYHYA
jgi:hypothetical protein